MLHNTASTGLGFDFSLSEDGKVGVRAQSAADNTPNIHDTYHTPTRNTDRTEPSTKIGPKSSGTMASERSYSTSRSASAMEGLLQAEIGDAMVELDAYGGSSGFREGHRIALGVVTPGGGSRQDKQGGESVSQPQQTVLSRHGTLLSTGATPERRAAELKSILGSANSRLKPGAAVLPEPGQASNYEGPTSFEQAKSRARVEVDIVLHSNTCVQGGHLQGHVKLHIRKRSKNESVVAISGGKVRVIGFESISNEQERYPFYQCSSPLSTVTTSDGLYREFQCDPEGFSQASEGIYVLPFSMHLPLSADHGVPKGAMHAQSGVAIRYIAMVSIKVKELESSKRSIAHFYRNCEIWPRLNPSIILAPAAQPLQMSTSRGLFRGGSGKVDMTASLHRLHWIAGQQCYVNVCVTNRTKKTIKSLTLSLLRSTVIFKPDLRLDALAGNHDVDPDACQTSTSQKQVSESVLEMGQRGARGHASAKGWWTGVSPGERLNFSHFIALPPDALTVTRSRLLEVEYSLRVALSAGTLRTADVQVTLPIRIVNFLSVDPPPSFPLIGDTQKTTSTENTAKTSENYIAERPHHVYHSRPKVSGLFGSYGPNSRLESLAEAEEENILPSEDSRMLDEPLDNAYDGIDSEFYEDYYDDTMDDSQQYPNPHEDLDDLSMYEDDADEIVQFTYPQVDPENSLRFADLYYASVQEGLDQAFMDDQEPQQDNDLPPENVPPTQVPISGSLQDFNIPKLPTQNYPELRPNARRPIILPRPNRPRGPSSFAQRVQEKIEAATATMHIADDSGSLDLTLDAQDPGTMHQGLSQPHTIYDPDDGSYFSAQAVVDQTGGLATQNAHGPQRDSTALTSVGTRPSTARGSRSPVVESTASSAFRAVSESTRSGSRLLPKPPSTDASFSADTLPETGVAPLPPHSGRLSADVDDTSHMHTHIAPQPHFAQPMQTADGEDAGSGIYLGVTRPPLVAPAAGDCGSASSVKDRIKELEERVRAVEAGEA